MDCKTLIVSTLAACSLLTLAGVTPAYSGSPNGSILRPNLQVEGGYFHARRGEFREMYGNHFNLGLSYTHILRNRWLWGVRASAMSLGSTIDRNSKGPRFKSLSAVPFVARVVNPDRRLSLIFGSGIGAAYRRIIVRTFDDYSVPQVYRLSQEEICPVWLAMAGVDVNIGSWFRPGMRLYYDHHFFSDPYEGHFGDTGGFTLNASLSFRI